MTPWEKPYANEHAARLKDPDAFLRIRQLWAAKGIRGIGGPLKSDPRGSPVLQAIRFKATQWTVAEAKRWLSEHDHKPILFEPATGGELAERDYMCAGAETRLGDLLAARAVKTATKEVIGGEHEVVVTISTDTVDRHGDIMSPEGVCLARFRRNPVVLYNHDYDGLPIGKSLWERPGPNGIIAKASFHLQTPLSREVWALIEKNMLNAWSVGFIPEEWEPLEKGFRVLKWDLLEYSCVPVPANFDALTHALKEARMSAPALVKSLGDLGLVAPDLVPQPVGKAPDGPAAEREDADMGKEQLKELTIEQLEAERPELVGQLKAAGQEEEAARASEEKAAADAEKAKAEALKEQSAEEKLVIARDEAAQAERDRLKALKEAFPERTEFAVEQFEKGASIEEARAAFRDVQLKELKEENAKLKSVVEGTGPVDFSGEQEDKPHLERAKDYQTEHGGPKECSITDALRATAPKRP